MNEAMDGRTDAIRHAHFTPLRCCSNAYLATATAANDRMAAAAEALGELLNGKGGLSLNSRQFCTIHLV